MKRGTPTGKHLASGSSLDRFSTRSLYVVRVQERNGTSTCLSALFTPFQVVSARLPLKPGYQAPSPPKSGRPSDKCGEGPATGLGPLPSAGSRAGRNGPGSLASGGFGGAVGCWALLKASASNANITNLAGCIP